MNCYLLKMKVNGIKNIDKEIEIEFYNKVLKKQFDLNSSNIKSIYGSNGAGKSAIVNAIDIYQNLILNENYLSDSKSLMVLNELVNKKIGHFSFETSFLFYEKTTMEIQDVMTHRIEIAKDNKDLFRVVYEKIVIHSSKNYLESGKVLVEIKDGQIINSDFKNECKHIYLAVMNLLDKQSISSVVYKKSKMLSLDTHQQKTYINRLLLPMMFVSNLNVTLNDADRHMSYVMMMQENINEVIINVFENIYINTGTDVIDKDKFNQYQNNIRKMCRFIKLFKSNLQSIDIETKEEGISIVCKKYFNYGNCRVESEFESTGIKKLITLYKAFSDFNNGKIVFIDELDANLHDVYLMKLLEYFSIYGNGQLCFTTHNLAPMDILKKRNYSIDFISDDSTLTSWKKNGNLSVSKLYREGMIQNSPFNVESFDFLGLFNEE